MEKDRTRLEFFFFRTTFLRGKKWNTHWGWVKLCISFDENHELTRFRVILVGRHYLCRVPKFDWYPAYLNVRNMMFAGYWMITPSKTHCWVLHAGFPHFRWISRVLQKLIISQMPALWHFKTPNPSSILLSVPMNPNILEGTAQIIAQSYRRYTWIHRALYINHHIDHDKITILLITITLLGDLPMIYFSVYIPLNIPLLSHGLVPRS